MGYTSGVYDILGECPDKDYAIRILMSIRQLDPDIVGTQFLQETERSLTSRFGSRITLPLLLARESKV